MREGDNRWGWTAGVLLAVAAVRLLAATVLVPAWEAKTHRAPFPDHYPALARSLVEEGTLGFQGAGAPITTTRGPGFPAWLALPLLAGRGGDRVLAWWATLPGLLGAALAAWACMRFGARPLALASPAAAALAGLHPLPVFTSSRGMADEFCGVLGLAGLVAWRCAETSARGRWLWAGVSGLALGAAMLTRATALLFLVALGAVALLSRASWRRALLVACVALLPALVWSLRASRLEGRVVFVHSMAAYNFWLGEAQDRFGLPSDPGSIREHAVPLMVREAGVGAAEAERLWYTQSPEQTGELERKLGGAAGRRILHDPLGYGARVARGLIRFWISGTTRSTTLAYAAVVLPFLSLVLVGALHSRESPRDPLLSAVLLAAALHALFYAAVCPMARYSVAVYPACALLAARGLAVLYRSGSDSPPPPP
ncbi:MAG TPA: hypothetical protein VFV75_21110 [Candidatus Polarisedimenticolaceae bacterium]|nr:hypothetical protein [Candidatus Polarisedimenticolaceae bacterium]